MIRSSSEITGALVGTLLGDSWISNRGEYGCEQISEALIDHKMNIIKSIHPDIKGYKHSRLREPTDFNKNPKRSYILQSNKHAYFEKLRKELYFGDNESKQVNSSILQKLTPEGLALWFMDDGFLYYTKSNSTRRLQICTDSFDEFSIKQIINYFNSTWDIQATVKMHTARKGYIPKPRITFQNLNMQKFILLTYTYFLPEFYYKINLQYKPKTLDMTRYCYPEYKEVAEYILQHIPKEDIV